MEDPVVPPSSTTEDPATPPSTQEPEDKGDKEPKMVPVKEVQAVRERARKAEAELEKYKAKEEEAERAKLTEIERYKADLDKANSELSTLKIGNARRDAVSKAIKDVGDGWSVDPDAVNAIVDDLVYDETTFADKVKRVVENVKKPKMGGQSPITGTRPNGETQAPAFQPGQKATPADLARMTKEQFAEHKRASSGR